MWRRGGDGRWHAHPPEGDRAPTATRPDRRLNPLLLWGYCITVLACVVGLSIQSASSGSSTASSACSLFTPVQKRALLDAPVKVKSESGLSGSTGGETVCTIIPSPTGSAPSVTSLFVLLRPAPDGFPSAIARRVGTTVTVDGRTAWWIPTPEAHVPGGAVPASAYSLVATKDGYLVSIEVTTAQDPKQRAVEAMEDALATI